MAEKKLHERQPRLRTEASAAGYAVLHDAFRLKVESWGLNQEQAAEKLGLQRPVLNVALNNSRRSTMDRMVDLLNIAGMKVVITVIDENSS